jgi:putative transport protein
MSFIIILGVIIGDLVFHTHSGKVLKLGIAGGTFLLALILGYCRRIGFVYGQMKPSARSIIRDLVLTLFILAVGMEAGNSLTKFSAPLLYRVLTASLAISLGIFLAMFFLILLYRKRKKAATVLSLFCGTTINTPAIGLVVEKTDSEEFMIPFASVYAIANVVIILLSQVLYLIY